MTRANAVDGGLAVATVLSLMLFLAYLFGGPSGLLVVAFILSATVVVVTVLNIP